MSNPIQLKSRRKRWSPGDGKASKATLSFSKAPSAKEPSADSPIAEPTDLGNAGGKELDAPLSGGGASSALDSATSALTGGAGSMGAAGAIGAVMGGGGITSRMPTPTQGPGTLEPLAAPPQFFDPNPMAANRFTVGNASRGNINLGGLWGGAKPNPAYDPARGPMPGNMPYLETSGFMGGVKRLFAGNNANELNASALGQSNAMRQWMWQQQAARSLDAQRDVNIHYGKNASNLEVLPKIAGATADATGQRAETDARVAGMQGGEKRAQAAFPLEQDERTARVRGMNVQTDDLELMRPGRLAELASRNLLTGEQVRATADATNRSNAMLPRELDHLASQTRNIDANTRTEDATRDPRVALTNAQAAGVGADTDYRKLMTQQAATMPHVEDGFIIDPVTGQMSVMGTAGLPAQYQPQVRIVRPGRIPASELNDAPPGWLDQGAPAPDITPRAVSPIQPSSPAPRQSQAPGGMPQGSLTPPAASTPAPAPAPMGSRQWLSNLGRSPAPYDPATDPVNLQSQQALAALLEKAQAAAANLQPRRKSAYNFGQ